MPRRVATYTRGRRLGRAEPRVDHRRRPARHLDVPVPVERLALVPPRRHRPGATRGTARRSSGRRRRRPPPENFDAAAAADPLGAAGVGRQPPRRQGDGALMAHARRAASTTAAPVPRRGRAVHGAVGVPRSSAASSTACGRARRPARCCSSSSAVFAGIVAGYLAFQDRLERTTARGARRARPEADDDQYLPHSSIWPFEMGVGMATSFTGMVLGWAILVPGLLILAHSIVGWIGQSRRRRALMRRRNRRRDRMVPPMRTKRQACATRADAAPTSLLRRYGRPHPRDHQARRRRAGPHRRDPRPLRAQGPAARRPRAAPPRRDHPRPPLRGARRARASTPTSWPS